MSKSRAVKVAGAIMANRKNPDPAKLDATIAGIVKGAKQSREEIEEAALAIVAKTDAPEIPPEGKQASTSEDSTRGEAETPEESTGPRYPVCECNPLGPDAIVVVESNETGHIADSLISQGVEFKPNTKYLVLELPEGADVASLPDAKFADDVRRGSLMVSAFYHERP